MYSVTQRINAIKQPTGGYLNPCKLHVKKEDDGMTLHEQENIHPSIIGLAVDYLSRYLLTADAEKAFDISLKGMQIAIHLKIIDEKERKNLFEPLNPALDDLTIINACKICSFDVWYRNFRMARMAKPYTEINPDQETIENIRIMVKRAESFFKKYGPVLSDGFTFEHDGYSDLVTAGDGDYLTETTLWDFKVSKKKPTSKHTLQILMYWIMGQHSGKKEFENIKNIGIFNPRLNTVYQIAVTEIPASVITEIEEYVICY